MDSDKKNIEFQHQFLLNNFDKEEHELSSLIICKKIIEFIQLNKIQSILLVHNSLYEPNIKKVIEYCLNKNIDLYVAFYDKNTYLKYFKLSSDNFNLHLYKYTIMPTPKNKKEILKEVDADMLLTPAMAYGKHNKILDYDEGLIKLIWLRNKEIKNICCYAFAFQETSFKNIKDLIQVDRIFTDKEMK